MSTRTAASNWCCCLRCSRAQGKVWAGRRTDPACTPLVGAARLAPLACCSSLLCSCLPLAPGPQQSACLRCLCFSFLLPNKQSHIQNTHLFPLSSLPPPNSHINLFSITSTWSAEFQVQLYISLPDRTPNPSNRQPWGITTLKVSLTSNTSSAADSTALSVLSIRRQRGGDTAHLCLWARRCQESRVALPGTCGRWTWVKSGSYWHLLGAREDLRN